ncbi:methylmalonyl-CoA mutase family protein [Larkinella punicea]|uniref:Methylmalonyl-CoA mutase n=1 Tax=Larkinella punicea TaxID=2315727 RepID=A0A368JQZ7_9BACT|nr:methylmalonyl-CoA mutase family protein [Larkinella punicea]RCR69902.1 methylmalonyl-CoA mutase [Larkinella punicea]
MFSIKSLFPAVTKAEWTRQVVADLKGKPLESLKRPTPDGLETEPFYTNEDLAKLPLATIQQSQRTGQSLGWLNVPQVRFSTESETNTGLRTGLTKGADGFLLDLTEAKIEEINWSRLLNGLKLSDTPVWFCVDGQSENVATALKQILPYQLKGGILDEPVARSLQSGTHPDAALVQMAEATRLTLDSPHFRTITVGSTVFHNAGATATQELAFTLNAVVDVFDHLTNAGLTMEQLIPKTGFVVSVGTSYFTEIAKLRALRILWQRLLTFYHSSFIIHHSSFIHAQTSTFYDTTATPYNNLLRATTEAMSAVIGGCDALTVHPYNAVFGEPDEFSTRIARNISILLKEEAHLDKTLDPSAGSYYLETLTNELVESAWALFLDVEKQGGLLKATESGFVPSELEKAYQAKVEAVKNGRILVGVTKFRVDEEVLLAKPARVQKTLPVLRLSQEFE